jgi:tRNA U38,U39,U40 pseudouridine synthase TruA
MARMIVGALVHVGLGKMSVSELRARFRQGGRRVSAAREVAPAGGLFLIRVRY